MTLGLDGKLLSVLLCNYMFYVKMRARIKFISDGYQQIFSDYTDNPKRAGGFSLSKWADCADCQISWLQQILRVSDQGFSDWALCPYLTLVLVNHGSSPMEGTEASMRGCDLMN